MPARWRSLDGETRDRGHAIRDAVLHVQRHVKEILRQLRPASELEFGLDAAVSELIAFWARRYPDISFERQVAPGLGLSRRGEDAAFHIVQEGLSNAVRHGKPTRIRIIIAGSAEGVSVSVEDDGGGLKQASGGGLGHMGLAGLEERVRALGGRFAVEDRPGQGVRLFALLPRQPVREVA